MTYFDLLKLEKDYRAIGYSVNEINIQKHKFYSLPFLLSVMTIIATIIMVYNKFKQKLLLNLFIGILFSVIILLFGSFYKSFRREWKITNHIISVVSRFNAFKFINSWNYKIK